MPAAAQPSPSRRAFLRGGRSAPTPPRPPGALDEAGFLDRCTRCAACLAACPEQVLVRGDGGYPQLDASLGECSFCGDCARVCGEGALQVARIPLWPWRAATGEGCLSQAGVFCQSCCDACVARAIRIPGVGFGAPQIDPAACTGCGACIAACPASALRLQRVSAQAEGGPA